MSYIVPRKMPKSCRDCPFNYDQMACKITGTRWWSDTMVLVNFDSEKERLYDCPLVEVKTPHGRLIDVDDFMRHLIINTADLRTLSTGTVGKALHEAPTVIEAEGETDGR